MTNKNRDLRKLNRARKTFWRLAKKGGYSKHGLFADLKVKKLSREFRHKYKLKLKIPKFSYTS